jgi:hypothetical protein
MLIENGDGTYTAGPYDVAVILFHVETKRFHVCFIVERPFPGPPEPGKPIRLKSDMHHTAGEATFEGAITQLKDLTKKITLFPGNVVDNKVYGWSGQEGFSMIAQDWREPVLKTFHDVCPGEDPPGAEVDTTTAWARIDAGVL